MDTLMKTATYLDAVLIARLLVQDVESVWEIMRGMKYSCYTELVKAVQNSLSESAGRTK